MAPPKLILSALAAVTSVTVAVAEAVPVSMDSLGSVVELAGTIALGIAGGGAITRFLVNKWLKDRETFETMVVAELKELSRGSHAAKEAAKEYVDHEVDGLMKHTRAARDVLLVMSTPRSRPCATERTRSTPSRRSGSTTSA